MDMEFDYVYNLRDYDHIGHWYKVICAIVCSSTLCQTFLE